MAKEKKKETSSSSSKSGGGGSGSRKASSHTDHKSSKSSSSSSSSSSKSVSSKSTSSSSSSKSSKSSSSKKSSSSSSSKAKTRQKKTGVTDVSLSSSTHQPKNSSASSPEGVPNTEKTGNYHGKNKEDQGTLPHSHLQREDDENVFPGGEAHSLLGFHSPVEHEPGLPVLPSLAEDHISSSSSSSSLNKDHLHADHTSCSSYMAGEREEGKTPHESSLIPSTATSGRTTDEKEAKEEGEQKEGKEKKETGIENKQEKGEQQSADSSSTIPPPPTSGQHLSEASSSSSSLSALHSSNDAYPSPSPLPSSSSSSAPVDHHHRLSSLPSGSSPPPPPVPDHPSSSPMPQSSPVILRTTRSSSSPSPPSYSPSPTSPSRHPNERRGLVNVSPLSSSSSLHPPHAPPPAYHPSQKGSSAFPLSIPPPSSSRDPHRVLMSDGRYERRKTGRLQFVSMARACMGLPDPDHTLGGGGERGGKGGYAGGHHPSSVSRSSFISPCYFQHDVIGLVCRRPPGGGLPDRWLDYSDYRDELVLDQILREWAVCRRGELEEETANSLIVNAEMIRHLSLLPARTFIGPNFTEALQRASLGGGGEGGRGSQHVHLHGNSSHGGSLSESKQETPPQLFSQPFLTARLQRRLDRWRKKLRREKADAAGIKLIAHLHEEEEEDDEDDEEEEEGDEEDEEEEEDEIGGEKNPEHLERRRRKERRNRRGRGFSKGKEGENETGSPEKAKEDTSEKDEEGDNYLHEEKKTSPSVNDGEEKKEEREERKGPNSELKEGAKGILGGIDILPSSSKVENTVHLKEKKKEEEREEEATSKRKTEEGGDRGTSNQEEGDEQDEDLLLSSPSLLEPYRENKTYLGNGGKVVAVINLCMTERYYCLPALRKEGIEAYWIKVDGKGEIPADRVFLLFFRLIAYLTHKHSNRLASSRSRNLSGDPQPSTSSSLPGEEKAREEEKERDRMISHYPSSLSSSYHTDGACGAQISWKKEREEDDGESRLEEQEKDKRSRSSNEEEGEKEEPLPYNNDKFTILVHCTHGVNRTGLFLSLLMMSLINCSAEFAVKAFETKRGYPFTKDFFTKWLRDRRLHGLPQEFRTALLPPVTCPLFLEVQKLLKEISPDALQERIKDGSIPTVPTPPALAEEMEAEEKEEKGRLERLESQLERKREVRRIMRRRGGRGVHTPEERAKENDQKKIEEEQERKEEESDVKMKNPLYEVEETGTNDKSCQDQTRANEEKEKEKEEENGGSEEKGTEEEERNSVDKKKEDERKEEAEEREKEKENEEEEDKEEDEEEKVIFAREYEEIERQKSMCIPPLPQALPADGIVLYGPIQSALLAPEELLIHLLQSRQDVKISSMEIFTGESLSSEAEIYPRPLKSLRTRRNEEMLKMRLARKGGIRREGGTMNKRTRSRKRGRENVVDTSSSSSSILAKNSEESASGRSGCGLAKAKGEKKEEEGEKEEDMKEGGAEDGGERGEEEVEVRKKKEDDEEKKKKMEEDDGFHGRNHSSRGSVEDDGVLMKEEKGGLETVEEEDGEEEDEDDYKSGSEEEENRHNNSEGGNSDDNTVDSKGEEKEDDSDEEEEKAMKEKEGLVVKKELLDDPQGSRKNENEEEKGKMIMKGDARMEGEKEDEETRRIKKLRTDGEEKMMSQKEEPKESHANVKGEKEQEEKRKNDNTATLSSSHVEGETAAAAGGGGARVVSPSPRPSASSMSLSELYTKGQGLYTQREIAYRLLEYRDEDNLRLHYIVKIQCADLQTFTWLLTHKFSRMRQQDIQAYPSNFYSLLYRRGKRKDKEALQRTADAVLFGQGAATGAAGGGGMKDRGMRNFPSAQGGRGGRSSSSRMMRMMINREGPGGGCYDGGVYYASGGGMRPGGVGMIGSMVLSPPSIMPAYHASQGNYGRGGEAFGPSQGGYYYHPQQHIAPPPSSSYSEGGGGAFGMAPAPYMMTMRGGEERGEGGNDLFSRGYSYQHATSSPPPGGLVMMGGGEGRGGGADESSMRLLSGSGRGGEESHSYYSQQHSRSACPPPPYRGGEEGRMWDRRHDPARSNGPGGGMYYNRGGSDYPPPCGSPPHSGGGFRLPRSDLEGPPASSLYGNQSSSAPYRRGFEGEGDGRGPMYGDGERQGMMMRGERRGGWYGPPGKGDGGGGGMMMMGGGSRDGAYRGDHRGDGRPSPPSSFASREGRGGEFFSANGSSGSHRQGGYGEGWQGNSGDASTFHRGRMGPEGQDERGGGFYPGRGSEEFNAHGGENTMNCGRGPPRPMGCPPPFSRSNGGNGRNEMYYDGRGGGGYEGREEGGLGRGGEDGFQRREGGRHPPQGQPFDSRMSLPPSSDSRSDRGLPPNFINVGGGGGRDESQGPFPPEMGYNNGDGRMPMGGHGDNREGGGGERDFGRGEEGRPRFNNMPGRPGSMMIGGRGYNTDQRNHEEAGGRGDSSFHPSFRAGGPFRGGGGGEGAWKDAPLEGRGGPAPSSQGCNNHDGMPPPPPLPSFNRYPPSQGQVDSFDYRNGRGGDRNTHTSSGMTDPPSSFPRSAAPGTREWRDVPYGGEGGRDQDRFACSPPVPPSTQGGDFNRFNPTQGEGNRRGDQDQSHTEKLPRDGHPLFRGGGEEREGDRGANFGGEMLASRPSSSSSSSNSETPSRNQTSSGGGLPSSSPSSNNDFDTTRINPPTERGAGGRGPFPPPAVSSSSSSEWPKILQIERRGNNVNHNSHSNTSENPPSSFSSTFGGRGFDTQRPSFNPDHRNTNFPQNMPGRGGGGGSNGGVHGGIASSLPPPAPVILGINRSADPMNMLTDFNRSSPSPSSNQKGDNNTLPLMYGSTSHNTTTTHSFFGTNPSTFSTGGPGVFGGNSGDNTSLGTQASAGGFNQQQAVLAQFAQQLAMSQQQQQQLAGGGMASQTGGGGGSNKGAGGGGPSHLGGGTQGSSNSTSEMNQALLQQQLMALLAMQQQQQQAAATLGVGTPGGGGGGGPQTTSSSSQQMDPQQVMYYAQYYYDCLLKGMTEQQAMAAIQAQHMMVQQQQQQIMKQQLLQQSIQQQQQLQLCLAALMPSASSDTTSSQHNNKSGGKRKG